MAGKKHYSVGYGRPPKHSQFKKGTSGNEKGRPKGTHNLATLFHKEMNQRIAITENGRRRTVTKGQAAVKQQVNKAATGDAKAFQLTMNISRELGDLALRDPFQESQGRSIELRVFEKNIETGELVRVKPGSRKPYDDE